MWSVGVDGWLRRVDEESGFFVLWEWSRGLLVVLETFKKWKGIEKKEKESKQNRTKSRPKKKEKKSCDNNIFYDCVIDDDYSCYISDCYYQTQYHWFYHHPDINIITYMIITITIFVRKILYHSEETENIYFIS